jgi:hypothetical protein
MARDFDDGDDSVEVTTAAFSGATIAAISFWVNFDALLDFGALVSIPSGLDVIQGGSFWGGSNNQAVILVTNGTTDWARTGDDVNSTSSWNHYFYVFDGNGGDNAARLKFFKNGVQDTLTFTGTIAATLAASSNLTVSDKLGSFPTNAKYAEVGVWTGGLPGGLTAQQAATALSNGYTPAHFRKNGAVYMPLIGRYSPELNLWGSAHGVLRGTAHAPHPRIIMPKRRAA